MTDFPTIERIESERISGQWAYMELDREPKANPWSVAAQSCAGIVIIGLAVVLGWFALGGK